MNDDVLLLRQKKLRFIFCQQEVKLIPTGYWKGCKYEGTCSLTLILEYLSNIFTISVIYFIYFLFWAYRTHHLLNRVPLLIS